MPATLAVAFSCVELSFVPKSIDAGGFHVIVGVCLTLATGVGVVVELPALSVAVAVSVCVPRAAL